MLLQPLADLVVREDVEPAKLDTLAAEDADRLTREAALRRVWVALHKEHDRRPIHEGLESVTERDGRFGRRSRRRERGSGSC